MNEAELGQMDRFLDHLRHERRLSPHTVENYRRDLHGMALFCSERGIVAWTELTPALVRSYIAQRHRTGLGGRSLARALSALRTFYHFLLREGAVTHHPALGLQAPKSPRRLPATLDIDQMTRLLDRPTASGAASGAETGANGGADDVMACRDHAMMELLYSSGLRLAELVRLDLNDIDLADGTVRVTGKGNKTRVVPVGSQAREALHRWLALRATQAAPDQLAVFISQRGGRITARAVQLRLRVWGLKQGLGTNLHPHRLRHSFASHLLESSRDLRAVQELLGHANISTTQIYTHLDFQHLARVYDETHPRAKKNK